MKRDLTRRSFPASAVGPAERPPRALRASPAVLALAASLALALPSPPLGAQRAAEEATAVFDPAPVLHLQIDLPEESRRQLEGNPKAFVRATVREGGKVYGNVGLRLKGSAGSFRDLHSGKPGFTLKFNQFVPAGRFHGQKKLHLNNGAQDPTYLSELIGNELFRAAGVPAQRVGHARVDLNGRTLGVYMVIEAVTRDFLSRWFADTSGTYFEGPGEVTGGLDVDSEGGELRPGGREALEALAEAAGESNHALRLERLEKLLDVDRFISFLCVEAITSHWDGYAIGTNNYHLYHEPRSGRFTFFPHGIDQLFQQPQAPAVIQGNGLVARGVLQTAAGKRRYRERFKVLFDNVFEVEAIQKRIDEATAKLRPVLHAIDPAQADAQAQHARDLARRIADRAQNLRQQMGARAGQGRPSLAFDREGRARPSGWGSKDHIGRAEFRRAEGEGERGGPALVISQEAGPCRGSWRTRVPLPAGRYLIAARVRTQGVQAAGGLKEGEPGGAGVRISRAQPRQKLTGDQSWTRFEFEFDFEPEDGWGEGGAVGEVELVCELQASRGTVWFDEESIEVRKLPPRAETAGGGE